MPRRQNFKDCPKCGRTFNSLGLPNHRAQCKGRPDPAPQTPTGPWPFPPHGVPVAALTRCAADRDGDCTHAQCPQLRDGEPAKSRRSCPLAAGVRVDAPAITEADAKRIRGALRLMQEMWDELHRRELTPTLMRQYADALSVLEEDLKARMPAHGVSELGHQTPSTSDPEGR